MNVGVDLGGTKLAVGTAESVQIISTPATSDDIIAAIDTLAGEARGIGLCVAGRVDLQSGSTFAAQLPQLHGVPLVKQLSRPGRRITLLNDADAAALAEHQFGAARGTHTSLYVTVSTGIGAGLVSQQRLYQGYRGQAVELGHAGGPGQQPCPCGRTGCIDVSASGTAITKAARALLGDPTVPVDTLSQMAAQGHAGIGQIVRQAAEDLAPYLGNACVLFDPQVIVMGGGVVLGYGELYLETLRRALASTLGQWHLPEIRVAQLGRQAGILGALQSLE
ncbi:ROK family protein [Deinococcus marmoris]|uniref:Sugar kinase n=1 Tax=Deinococcus marmoris TaxID=249408 RepID=A0A1U7P3G9_9DEIO|nr:ROK family protein [Deinococcus marmoris]OLV19698.1 sugar kinase [Deinococcus marmoris]